MNIEIVLTQDDPKLGKRGDIVKVSPGYATNFLFPHQKAKLATPAALKSAAQEKERQAKEAVRLLEKAKALAEKIASITIFIEVEAGQLPEKSAAEGEGAAEEKLYGSVSTHEIAGALEKRAVSVEKKNIHLEEPIKKLGAYRIPIKLHAEVEAVLKMHVVKKK